jgi:hypothetical protein
MVIVHVAVEIHGHEAGELQEARIDVAHIARMRERYLDHSILAEPVDAARHRQAIDDRRVAPGVDRSTHQDHRLGHFGILALRHQRNGGEHRYGGLADRHHMRIGAQELQHFDDVIDIVVEIEAAIAQRDLAGIDPVGDIDIDMR